MIEKPERDLLNMDKRFLIIMATLAVIFVGIFAISSKNNPSPPRIGTAHTEQGRQHIPRGQPHEPYNSEPPSSGPHYADSAAPALWGVYIEEVPEEVFIHNEEHGGVIITYRPDLPKDQIEKLQKLFAPPYSDPGFKPSRAIVTPRSKNTKPIELAAWTYTLSLDRFDKAKLKAFYLQRVGHGPEIGAGPYNSPINQAK
jgi:hypothetical protein